MKKVIWIVFFCAVIKTGASAQILQQERSMWCWASCIQSALSQANVYQMQSQIVSRLSGWPQDRPANTMEIVALLQSYNFRAWVVPYPATPQQLFDTLQTGWKVIAFVNPANNPQMGHFIMLQGVSRDGQIIISDPASAMTYEQNLNSLYYAWNWSGSVVVGGP